VPDASEATTVVEVFADVCCPFTHLGLLRFVERRAAVDRHDVRLWVRAWPLEIVNGSPLGAAFIAEEIEDIRGQVAPEAFVGFDQEAFPPSSLPAMTLAALAYDDGLERGEQVSLELRHLLFEQGTDIADPATLRDVADRHGLDLSSDQLNDPAPVLADLEVGRQRGVIGSPHFYTPSGGYFCPSLDIERDARGHLRIHTDPEGFEAFMADSLR
jgi:predicted DsbA family dithiol-disulfide isomerase